MDLANAVVSAVEAGPIDFKFLYPPTLSIKEKLHTIVKEMYGVRPGDPPFPSPSLPLAATTCPQTCVCFAHEEP